MVQDRVRDGRAGWLGERSIGQSPGYMGQLSKYWHMLADSKSKNSKCEVAFKGHFEKVYLSR